MQKLISTFFLVLIYISVALAQDPAVLLELSGQDGVTIPIAVGLDLTATDGIDTHLGEGDLPPFPPAGAFEIRFDLQPYTGSSLSSYKDFRAPTGGFPFTGTVQHLLWFQPVAPGNPININYSLPAGAAIRLVDNITGTFVNLGPFTGTGSTVIPGSYTTFGTKVYVYCDYTDIGPAGGLTIAPPSLDFGLVAVGGNSTLQATVTNSGTSSVDITNVTSSNPQFTFSPNVFPIIIPAGGNQVFDITFSPTATGLQSATIDFIHTGPGSPTAYSVQGTGASAGPTFSVDPTSLNFGNVVVGASDTRVLTVSNDGLTNPMTITSASSSNTDYTVTPNPPAAFPIIIPAAGSYDFDVTFAPAAPGISSGNVEFLHDAPSAPDLVPVTGNGVAEFGLIFQEDTTYRLEDDFYQDRMQLIALEDKAQAIQFRLQVNKNTDDNVILTFQNIQKGPDVSDASWILDYNIFRGPITGNGASVDEIFVLLYNLNQNGGLDPGNYTDLLRVNYRVADLPALQDSVKSSFLITHAEASTYQGFPTDITPSRDELVVIARNRVSSLGDVNGDGCIDILDLIMVVDHIVGRDSLFGDAFTRADIAPWVPGNALPDPDGEVNVQDLSLIQNIILTGMYPNGDEIGDCGPGLPKSNGSADATVTLYINNEGITAMLNTTVGIRGAQLEFNNVINDPASMVISTDLGQGHYNLLDQLLKTVMYDRLGTKYIDVGEHIMADMPFVISNPEDITLRNVILIDINKRKLGHIEVEIVHGVPTLPLDYVLWQNYPNPFNPSTSVQFQVPKTSDVTVTIYDMLGQQVKTLFAGEVMRGTYTAQWDGRNDAGVQMSSGSYVYRMNAGDFVQSKKMMLVK